MVVFLCTHMNPVCLFVFFKTDCLDLQTLRKNEKVESDKNISLAQNDLSNLADEARIRHTEYSEQLTVNTQEHQEQLHR